MSSLGVGASPPSLGPGTPPPLGGLGTLTDRVHFVQVVYEVPLAQVHGELRGQKGRKEAWAGGCRAAEP